MFVPLTIAVSAFSAVLLLVLSRWFPKLPAALLERMATRIVNEVKGINRVVFDITSKPPGTIEWE